MVRSGSVAFITSKELNRAKIPAELLDKVWNFEVEKKLIIVWLR